MRHRCGVVVIGRNEGERLVRCLQSVAGRAAAVVYVDSGSVDGSRETARRLGAIVVELDPGTPFTAARARNMGAARMFADYPEVEYVQFVDGDCELSPRWLTAAESILRAYPGKGVVCGRRRERFPGHSIYNRLCDLEWDTPVGEAAACGGDAMFRRSAFEEARGFRSGLIAGEEPELCHRLRAAGWQVYRLDHDMTVHDAAMTSFAQWWRRAVRAGHAYEECSRLHPGRRGLWRNDVRSIRVWAIALPVLIVAAFAAFGPWGLLGLAAYPAQVARVCARPERVWKYRYIALYGVFCVLAKFPQFVGAVTFHKNRMTRTPSRLIEYKRPLAGGVF